MNIPTKMKEVNLFNTKCAQIVLKLGCVYQFMFKISINKVFSREFESLRPHQNKTFIGAYLVDKLLSVIFMVGVLLLVLPVSYILILN